MNPASTKAPTKKSRTHSGARMPAKNRNGLPAYQRIQSAIRKRIDGGQLHPGDAVASERDLAKIHQVSLMTARHALAFLEREGIVERRRGIGTFVAAPKIHFNKLMSYTEQMSSRSLVAGSKVLFAKVLDNENEAAARLSLPPTSHIIKLERLRHAAGEPFALETCYLNAAEFSGLLDAPIGRESLHFPPRSPAAHSPGHLFHQRPADHVCAGFLSFGPSQSRHSPVPVRLTNLFPWLIFVSGNRYNAIQRGRRMLVILKRDEEDISRQAAQLIASAVHKKPALALGLATGSTMVGVYKQLVRLHKQGSLDFSRVVTFNLDEYLGLSAAHPQSFHYFMQENLFAHINVDPRNVHIPDGTIRGNYDQYCASYEEAIRKTGGIDLQILGIGRNGHIGFNEPTSSIGSRTRLKVLSRETMDDNSKFFAADEESPRCAITMGIGTILEARKILLLATGQAKSAAVAKSIEGPITSAVSASALQLHPDVTFIIDDAAASQLTQRDYYHRVLEMTALLTPERLS